MNRQENRGLLDVGSETALVYGVFLDPSHTNQGTDFWQQPDAGGTLNVAGVRWVFHYCRDSVTPTLIHEADGSSQQPVGQRYLKTLPLVEVA